MVDIIIPVYNALDTLELAVTSALMQGDVRILLVTTAPPTAQRACATSWRTIRALR